MRGPCGFESGREGPLERHQVHTCFAWRDLRWAAPAFRLQPGLARAKGGCFRQNPRTREARSGGLGKAPTGGWGPEGSSSASCSARRRLKNLSVPVFILKHEPQPETLTSCHLATGPSYTLPGRMAPFQTISCAYQTQFLSQGLNTSRHRL